MLKHLFLLLAPSLTGAFPTVQGTNVPGLNSSGNAIPDILCPDNYKGVNQKLAVSLAVEEARYTLSLAAHKASYGTASRAYEAFFKSNDEEARVTSTLSRAGTFPASPLGPFTLACINTPKDARLYPMYSQLWQHCQSHHVLARSDPNGLFICPRYYSLPPENTIAQPWICPTVTNNKFTVRVDQAQALFHTRSTPILLRSLAVYGPLLKMASAYDLNAMMGLPGFSAAGFDEPYIGFAECKTTLIGLWTLIRTDIGIVNKYNCPDLPNIRLPPWTSGAENQTKGADASLWDPSAKVETS